MRDRLPFHEAWIWITLLTLIIGYAFGVRGLLAEAGLLAVVLGLAWAWNRASLDGVRYRRWFRYRRGFPGEETQANITVENRKLLPLVWLRTEDRWPTSVGPEQEGMLSPSHRPDVGFMNLLLAMRGYSRTIRRFKLKFRQRGIYQLGPVEANSGDPFGLFLNHRKDFVSEDRLVVFPEVHDLAELGLKPQDPFGERPSRRQLFEDISRPMGVRDYQPEDGFRFIHWPATAKMGELQTRLFQPVRGLDLVVCLNASTLSHYWEGTEPETLELLIQTSASIVMQAMDQGYRVGLLSNGSIAHAGRAFRIPPGRSRGHLPMLLEALAGLTPVVTAPFERYLLAQAPRLEYGSILMVVSAITPPELQEALLRLRVRNRRTALISLNEQEPPYIEGVETFHAPLGNGLTFT